MALAYLWALGFGLWALRFNDKTPEPENSLKFIFIVENKIVDLEEELRMIGENLKTLEVAEEKAQQREEEYKKQIKQLSEKLKSAESR